MNCLQAGDGGGQSRGAFRCQPINGHPKVELLLLASRRRRHTATDKVDQVPMPDRPPRVRQLYRLGAPPLDPLTPRAPPILTPQLSPPGRLLPPREPNALKHPGVYPRRKKKKKKKKKDVIFGVGLREKRLKL
ncbi:hypothetical protein GW17_00055547 [Ensete ventricosum]|nr:hypothetical protein GW17_00055547 [Ensete ventricosum]